MNCHDCDDTGFIEDAWSDPEALVPARVACPVCPTTSAPWSPPPVEQVVCEYCGDLDDFDVIVAGCCRDCQASLATIAARPHDLETEAIHDAYIAGKRERNGWVRRD